MPIPKDIQKKITQRTQHVKTTLGDQYDFILSHVDNATLTSWHLEWETSQASGKYTKDFLAYCLERGAKAGWVTRPVNSNAQNAVAIANAFRMANDPTALRDVFLTYVEENENDCWVWTGNYTTRYRMRTGDTVYTPVFGPGKLADPPTRDARRYIYRTDINPTLSLYTHLTLKPTCHPLCVNPDHIMIRGRPTVQGDET